MTRLGTPIAFCALLLPFVAQAQDRAIWQIGTFDDSPVEFLHQAKGPVKFEIGRSDAARDWPAHQDTGVPYNILFSIPSAEGNYSLKIVALIEKPRVPAMRIEVNGHSGTFYLHPQLSYSRSDFTYAFDPHESKSSLEVPIPSSFLKAGANSITITGVDEPATPKSEEEIGGIAYDAVALLQHAAGETRSEEPAVELEPTIFFHQTPTGLTEVVDGFVRFARPWKDGTLDLEIADKHYSAKLAACEFGEQKVSFDVPEFNGTIRIRIRTSHAKRTADISLTAKRKWTIFIVPHTHLDVGYTDYQGKVAETQARVLTQAGNLIQDHPDFRFSMDGSWNLEQLLNTRSKAKRDEILGLIRTGKMAMPAQYVNLLTGYTSLETLYRSLYTSKALSRTYGLPFEYANITDVPSYSGSYPSVLASSGVKYWVAASNNDRAPIFYYDHWNEKSPFWWEGPDGKRVLFWYSRHYEQVQTMFGLPPQLSAVRESLPIYMQAYSSPTYKPDVALIYGSQVENTDLFPSTAVFATEWNKGFAYPKLNYSTFPDFFHYVEQHYATDLPTFKGDGGGYWEDGIGSDAYYAAEDRVNQNRALSAEVLSTVIHSVDADLNPPDGLLTDIWRNIMLFGEHTWLSYNSVSQPDEEESIRQQRVKDNRAEAGAIEIDDLMNRSLSQLANNIHVPANTLVVFNSLNWRRDLTVETDLFANPKLVDLTTQQEVPLEVLYTKEKFFHVRFLAKDMPPVGYKCFSITYGDQPPPAPKLEHSQTIENAYYRVKVNVGSGSLTSIYDKELKRELVDTASPYKFGQYVYVTGGDGDTQMINPFPALPPGVLTTHGASGGEYLGTEQLPWCKSIRLTSTGLNTPKIETEVLLYNSQKKIEFRYHVRKQPTSSKEAVYFTFPVAASNPSFHFATQQGWVNPAHDLMKGGSLEWFNIQHWMAVGDANVSVGIVPLDASLASFGDINRGKWPGDFTPKSATLFSYVMNNYWHTNYRAEQGGDFVFRYALTSAPALDGNALTRLGMDEMRPPEVDYVVSQDKAGNPDRPLPREGASFLTIDAPNVSLSTWKRAEDGNGTILRLQETSGKPVEAVIALPKTRIASAHICSGVEDDIGSLQVTGGHITVPMKPFEVITVRIPDR